MKSKPLALPLQVIAAAALGFGGVTLATQPQLGAQMIQAVSSTVDRMDCNIKGNISIDTRERIYHMPGQRYYSQTKISQAHGEQWFCTEMEAQAAGWRKSHQ